MRRTFVITGTDTGVGKTVVTALLTRHLRTQGKLVAVAKPLSSGSREDARRLRAAVEGAQPLGEINPWHFRAALAPDIAAKMEGREVNLREVTDHLLALQSRAETLLVEGAGGLLSPLGVEFSTRELIVALRAIPLIVCASRLGALNQVLLTLAALPARYARLAQVLLVSPPRPTLASRTNLSALTNMLHPRRVVSLPWLDKPFAPDAHDDARLRGLWKVLAG